jgi:hypothetical protein
MTSLRLRIWVTGVSLLTLVAILVAIALHPWPLPEAGSDPRVVALKRREVLLKHRAVDVQRTLKRRWQLYERRLAARQAEIADARRRYEAQQAAARRAAVERARVLALAAQLRAGAQRSKPAPTASTIASSAPAPAPPRASAPAAAPAVKVVTLPPPVTVVSLPPVTVSATS